MSRFPTYLVAAAAVATAIGCTDVRGGTVANAQERDAAYTLVAQLDAINQLTRTPDDSGALLTAASYEGVVGVLAPAGVPIALLSRAGVPDDAACVSASGGAATFSGCAIAEHTVDGTVSSTNGSVVAEIVDVFVVSDGVHGAATVNASLDTHDSFTEGAIDIDLMWTAGSADHVMDARVRVEGVVVDDAGCPTGGTITVSGTVDDGGHRVIALAFGPTCGDLLVER